MNLLLIGPQGCGKGTLAKKITADFGLVPISTGDLFRESISKGEALGLEAKKYMDKGVLVPLDLTIQILSKRLQNPDCKKGVIFDGFPRSIEQAEALAKIANVDYVVQINIPYEECIKRLLARRVCDKCGFNYSTLTYEGDTCEKCGGKLFQRDDDNLEAIKTRLEVYEKSTTPLIDFYADRLFVIEGQDDPYETYKPVKNFLKGRV